MEEKNEIHATRFFLVKKGIFFGAILKLSDRDMYVFAGNLGFRRVWWCLSIKVQSESC